MQLIRTCVAPLLTSKGAPICSSGTVSRPIYWLDELLHGGLRRPEKLCRPLVVLLSGPPGAGKSLLAQQMLWSAAHETVREHGDEPGQWFRSVIISTETPASAIAENLANLGFEPTHGQTAIFWCGGYIYDERHPFCLQAFPALTGSTASVAQDAPSAVAAQDDAQPRTGVPHVPLVILSPIRSGEPQPWTYESFISQISGCWKILAEPTNLMIPDVLAIDSLNVLPERIERRKERDRKENDKGHQAETETEREMDSVAVIYDRLLRLVGDRLKILILIVDTPSSTSTSSTQHRYWEYVADVIIKLDSTHLDDSYFSQWLEIVKTRFQPHILGRQLVKVFPFEGQLGDTQPVIDKEGARPHLIRGGFFVFPSEHYVLSRIRTGHPLITLAAAPPSRLQYAVAPVAPGAPAPSGPGDIALPTDVPQAGSWTPERTDAALNWPVPWCYELVGGGGVPLRSTTAIVGRRGTHKSHFAYQFLLDGVANSERTLTVSFRDNPDNVYATLGRISQAPQYSDYDLTPNKIHGLNSVIYQRPGYVTPQEFLHRLIAEVGEHHPTRVMVGAIDQWSAAYPLLAKSSILLPAIIDFLNTHGAASMIIGVEGSGHAIDWSGLTSKAEVVLAFEYVAIDWVRDAADTDYRPSAGYAIDGYPIKTLLRAPRRPDDPMNHCQPKVVARAVRVPHGRAGLARAVVEYESESAEKNAPAGLRLVPLAPEYPVGVPL